MRVRFVMPQMGENVKEGTIVKWHKAVGDRVSMDENILEISTDKVDSEIPSTAAGIVVEILVPEGKTVAVGTPLALIETAAAPATSMPAEEKKATPRDETAGGTTARGSAGGRPASPLVHAITARESYTFGSDGTAVIPMDRMRQTIARRLTASQQTAAHVTSLGEADLSNVVSFHERHKDAFEREHGFKLTYTPFFIRAAVEVLREFPWVNGSIDADRIVLHNYVNVGIAVAIEGGRRLIVPVIKNAHEMSLAGLARAANDLTVRARAKQLSPADVQGGTFTVTNVGTSGNLFTTPIINQPQVAILGVGAIRKRPVVVEDAIGIRPIVYLSLTFDHRLVDGALGGMFLQRVCKSLERFDPDTSISEER